MAVGTLAVSRALPVRGRRLIGAWCFLDRYGPLTFAEGRPMDVAPHPHIGLQTVTWLLAGEVAHDDSLGCEGVARPGAVNVMTSGRGISHAERTPVVNSGQLSGIQLWTALPDAQRQMAPAFQHVARVPEAELPGGVIQVFAGALAGAVSPASHYSDLLGADLHVHARGTLAVALESDYEHGLLVLDGDCALDGQPLAERTLYYMERQRTEASFTSRAGARVLLIGGRPFDEPILMWWNFVARTAEEIEQARTAWEERRIFGDIPAYDGPRLPAPSLQRLAPPNPLS